MIAPMGRAAFLLSAWFLAVAPHAWAADVIMDEDTCVSRHGAFRVQVRSPTGLDENGDSRVFVVARDGTEELVRFAQVESQYALAPSLREWGRSDGAVCRKATAFAVDGDVGILLLRDEVISIDAVALLYAPDRRAVVDTVSLGQNPSILRRSRDAVTLSTGVGVDGVSAQCARGCDTAVGKITLMADRSIREFKQLTARMHRLVLRVDPGETRAAVAPFVTKEVFENAFGWSPSGQAFARHFYTEGKTAAGRRCIRPGKIGSGNEGEWLCDTRPAPRPGSAPGGAPRRAWDRRRGRALVRRWRRD
jgi:hypothetical protein